MLQWSKHRTLLQQRSPPALQQALKRTQGSLQLVLLAGAAVVPLSRGSSGFFSCCTLLGSAGFGGNLLGLADLAACRVA